MDGYRKKIIIQDLIAPLYRRGIFELLDKDFNVTWLFGKGADGIKELDWSLLKDVKEAKIVRFLNPFYLQKGIIKYLFSRKRISFVVNGEPYFVTSWVVSILARIIPNKKVYFWTHGWYGRESFLKKTIKKIYFRLPTKSFIYGNYARNLMISNGLPSDKLVVIHNSLDYDVQLRIRERLKPSDIYKSHFKNNNANIIFIGR